MKTTRVLRLLITVCCASFASTADALADAVCPRTPLSMDAALADAKALAARHAGAITMRIDGRSMLPYFGDGSVVVVRPLAASRVRPGMIVVYTNHDNEQVAHRVMSEADGGWVVRGYNNDQEDSTLVTGDNLVGVVYATFYSNGKLSNPSLLAAIAASTPVALAAPAK